MRISDWSSDVCSSDLRVFGPPLCVTTTSSWPWIDRRVSGLLPATIRPIKTRFPYGSPIRLALLLRSKSLTHYTKGTPSLLRAPTTCTHPEIGRASCRERVCQYV